MTNPRNSHVSTRHSKFTIWLNIIVQYCLYSPILGAFSPLWPHENWNKSKMITKKGQSGEHSPHHPLFQQFFCTPSLSLSLQFASGQNGEKQKKLFIWECLRRRLNPCPKSKINLIETCTSIHFKEKELKWI